MRRFSVISAIAALFAGLIVVVSGSSASADDPSRDIWGITSGKRVVNSNSCRYVTVTARTNLREDDVLDIDTEVWLGGRNTGSFSLSHVGAGRLRGQYYHCPSEGLGRFRIGPTQISVWDGDYNVYSYMDGSSGSFVAKQASRFTKLKASRSGSKVTIKSNPQFWASNYPGEWTPFTTANVSKSYRSSTAFRLQRRNANGTGSWRTVKTAKAPKNKTLVFKVTTKRKYQYRIVLNETTRTFQSVSRGVRK